MTILVTFDVNFDRYADNVTLETQIAIEESKMTTKMARDLCSLFLVDEAGAYLPMDQAIEVLNKLTIRQMTETAETIVKKFQEASEAQTPLAPGGKL